jgi:hypothetical protein
MAEDEEVDQVDLELQRKSRNLVDVLNCVLYKCQCIGHSKPLHRTSVAGDLHVGGELKVGEHFLDDYALKEWVDTLYALKADVELDNLILWEMNAVRNYVNTKFALIQHVHPEYALSLPDYTADFDSKADLDYVNSKLDLKADYSYTNEVQGNLTNAMMNFSSSVSSQFVDKADKSYVDEQLSEKASLAYVDAQLERAEQCRSHSHFF